MAIVPKKIIYDVAIKSTSHTRSYKKPPEVFTSDLHSVQFRFNLLDVEVAELNEGAAVSTIEITTRDGSFFQYVGETSLDGTTVVYDMKEAEGNHAGLAKIQLILKLGISEFTSDEYEFNIKNGLRTSVPVEIYVQNWDTLTAQANAYLTQMANDIQEFDVALETGVLATNIAAKLTELSTTFAPDLVALKSDMVKAKADILLNNRGLGTTYVTLVALQAAFPTGDTYDHIVSANGHRYFWNGSAWTDGGIYQAIELADGSVLDKHVGSITSRKITDERFIDLSKAYGMSGHTGTPVITPSSISYVDAGRTVGNSGYTKLQVPIHQDQTLSATVTITPPVGAVSANVFQFTVYAYQAGVLKWLIATRTLSVGVNAVSIPLDYDAIKATMDTNGYDEIRILLWNQAPTVDAGTTVVLTNFKQTNTAGNVITQNIQDNLTRLSRTVSDNTATLGTVKTEVEGARGGYSNIDTRMDKIADGTDITKLAASKITDLTAEKILTVGGLDLSATYVGGTGSTVHSISAKSLDYSFPFKDGTSNGGYTKTGFAVVQDQTITADITVTLPQGAVASNAITLGIYYARNGTIVASAASVVIQPTTTSVSLALNYNTIKAAILANTYDPNLMVIVWNQGTMDAGTRILISNVKQIDSLGTEISFSVSESVARVSKSVVDLGVDLNSKLYNKAFAFLTNTKDFMSIETRSWFSVASYTVLNGLYTIWWTADNPGIRMNIPNDWVQSDHSEPLYIRFRARVLEGPGSGALKFTAINKNVKTVEVQKTLSLTYDWQDFTIPFRFNQAPSDGVWDGVYALLQIKTGNTALKIQVDNPIIYSPVGNSPVKSVLNQIAYKENNPEITNSLLKGQLPKFDVAYITPVPVTGYHNVTPVDSVVADGQVIDKVSYYAPLGAKTVTFTVGYIDQYSLLVTISTFSLLSSAGYNEYVPITPVSVPAGARLFMDISQFNVLYDSNDPLQYIKHSPVFIQEESTTYNSGGYSGMTFYESTHMIPFAYTVRSKTLNERMSEAEVALDLTGGATEVVTPSSILRNPDGVKYSLMVDATGVLKAVSHAASKVFVMGNSLTLGFSSFGMAASDPDHDWYHYVKEELTIYKPTLAMTRIAASPWEGGVSGAERLAYLNGTVAPALATDTDLIIIQLGDNVNTAEKQATFGVDAIALVQWLRNRCPNARILWVNGWYGYTFCFPLIQIACDTRGAEVVDIRPLATDSANKSALGNQWTQDYITYNTIVSEGVASHPGNTGMARIAQEIISVLDID